MHVLPPTGQTLLGFMDNVMGSAAVGTFPVTTTSVSVYLTCAGKGAIKIVIDPVGSFPLECEATGAASANRFQVSGYGQDHFSVSIAAQPGQVWAATVAADS